MADVFVGGIFSGFMLVLPFLLVIVCVIVALKVLQGLGRQKRRGSGGASRRRKNSDSAIFKGCGCAALLLLALSLPAYREHTGKVLAVLAVLVIVLGFIKQRLALKRFEASDYHKATGFTYRQVFGETSSEGKGRLGEYKVYEALRSVPGKKRFLFNALLPLGEATSELDLIMLHATGIYVIESKNYGGYIRGSDDFQNWKQQFKGKPDFFYSPVLQNEGHVKALSKFLAGEGFKLGTETFHSVIVFGENCKLDVTLKKSHCLVVKQGELGAAIEECLMRNAEVLGAGDLERLYRTLFPLTQKGETDKQKHIRSVEETRFKMGRRSFRRK